MGRRRKTSAATDLMDWVAKLPWWAGVALAAIFYLVLHAIATQPLPTTNLSNPPGFTQITDAVPRLVLRTFATFGQYILPFLCLAGAGISAWRRRERRQLLDTAATTRSAASAVDGMTWQTFERLVGEAFRRKGYRVLETGGQGQPDGGVDLVLTRNGEKHLVQCKHWRAFKVGVDVVRELYGVMAAKGAAGGFVVTSGHFTQEAKAFASGRNVGLIDGEQLQGLIREARGLDAPRASTPETTAREAPRAASDDATLPNCPVCSRPMTRRVARKGAKAGGEFLGCTGYPQCRGTRPLN